MRIAAYTLTRDRLQYTQECFTALREMAGCPFDHFVVDNGSRDDTMLWLTQEYVPHWIWPLDENVGISRGSNIALRAILAFGNYDLVVKFDNDCMVKTPGILAAVSRIYSGCKEAERWVLSPRVDGINKQPRRARDHALGGHPIGVTAIVGGLFQVTPEPIARQFYKAGGYDESLPLARGQDDQYAEWLRINRYANGYIEDVAVSHHETTDGQAKRYPDYFRRKWDHEERERTA